MSLVHQPWISWSYPFDSQYGKLKEPIVHISKNMTSEQNISGLVILKSSGNLWLQDEFPFPEEQTPCVHVEQPF